MKTIEARKILVKQIIGERIDEKINRWLNENPDVEVIDIKFATSATNDEWSTDALIIYRQDL